MSEKSYSYEQAGVSIAAGNALVKAIGPLVKATARPGADAEIGGFGGFFDPKAAGFKDPLLVAANDGVGTKVKLAIDHDRHDAIGIDLVAMCVNDLIVQGALYPILASLFVLRYAIQGLGATAVPTFAGFMELVFRSVAGLVLVAPLGFLGIALAAPLAWVGALIPVAFSWFAWRRALMGQPDGAPEPTPVRRLRLARAS